MLSSDVAGKHIFCTLFDNWSFDSSSIGFSKAFVIRSCACCCKCFFCKCYCKWRKAVVLSLLSRFSGMRVTWAHAHSSRSQWITQIHDTALDQSFARIFFIFFSPIHFLGHQPNSTLGICGKILALFD